MTILPALVVLCVLLMLSGCFSGAETALFSLSKVERRRLFKEHPFQGGVVERLLHNPRRTLIALLIGNMVVNTLATTIVTLLAVHLFGVGGVSITLSCFAALLIVAGEIVPKSLAARTNELCARMVAVPLDIFARAIFPVRKLVRLVTDRILSWLVRERVHDADFISELELKALVRIGEEEGVLDSDERKRLQKVLGFGDRMVKEIMTPRTDLVAFDLSEGTDKLIAMIQQSRHTYIPVFKDRLDHLQGVIRSQDFMLSDQSAIKSLIQPPYFIPETKRIDELLFEFQQTKRRVAVCVDEYGGTAGVVTREDIVEEIFGEIYDEHETRTSSFTVVNETTWMVIGQTPLDEVSEAIGVPLRSDTSDTLGGFILELAGHIPEEGEELTHNKLVFTVTQMVRRRIGLVQVEKRRP